MSRPADAKAYVLCSNLHCRALFEQGRHLSEALFEHHLASARRMQRELEAKVERERVWAAARQEEAAAAFAQLRSRRRGLPPADLELAVSPGRPGLRPLSARRRKRYAERLDGLIAAAFSRPAPPPAAPAPPRPPAQAASLPERLCGVCAGGCCRRGGEHAYLSETTIARVRAANPHLGPAEVRAAYLDRLPARSVRNSCLNHARDGCSLPRELRSDTCNTFACAPLVRLEARVGSGDSDPTVIVLRHAQEGVFLGAAILTGSTTRILRTPWGASRPAKSDR